jgi:rare lipoprotein A
LSKEWATLIVIRFDFLRIAVWIFLVLLIQSCTLVGSIPTSIPTALSPREGETVPVSDIPDAVPRSEVKTQYGNPESYSVFGVEYQVLDTSEGYHEIGIASWYGEPFHGRRSSSGEQYDMYKMTAAHKTLPLPTYLRVTNKSNGYTVVVRVNDRGPFVDGRIIDLSYTAALKLEIVEKGTALVEVVALDPPAQNRK